MTYDPFFEDDITVTEVRCGLGLVPFVATLAWSAAAGYTIARIALRVIAGRQP